MAYNISSLPCRRAHFEGCRDHKDGQVPFKIVYEKEPCRQQAAPTGPFSTHSRSKLEILPTELLALVTQHLDLVSNACLVLCSKTLLHQAGSKPWRVLAEGNNQNDTQQNKESRHISADGEPREYETSRRIFLRLLCQQPSSDFIYCESHHLMRRRQITVKEDCCRSIVGNPISYLPGRKIPNFSMPMYKLSLVHVHRILHHGLCLKTLACTSNWIRPYSVSPDWERNTESSRPFKKLPFMHNDFIIAPGPNLTLEHSVSGLISLGDRELVIETKYTFGRKGDFDLREAIMKLDFPLCHHVRIGHSIPHSSIMSWLRTEQPTAFEIPVHNARWISSIHKCRWCPTEFMMLRKNWTKPHYYSKIHTSMIEIRVWQNFGTGKSASDRNWSRMVQRSFKEEYADEDVPAGQVKRAYNTALQAALSKGPETALLNA